MTAAKRNFSIGIIAFAFMCLVLASCDHHTCPTYSKATEKTTDNQG
jgi:hypothetical protein